MKATRLNNSLDMHLVLTKKEFSKLEKSTKETIIACTSLENNGNLPKNRKIKLVYRINQYKENEPFGIDCSNMMNIFDNQSIPIYITRRALQRLKNEEYCAGFYSNLRVEISVK